MLLSLVYRYHP
jgi:hypothetical protein